ncbi:AraC family transcriptional regulator [Arcicella aquatica]|uniref:AraC family transcriptional regulator n=1 Tax=Arcicella aquatica TaxID=217141 RepID=A0ABU5QPI2_9BACT|nr:AraC family transcriptional regulator [Arcicella aquatica]MEA5258997.1 AraC family transcriptional regulator [Arcicella aquatica]
MKAILEDLSMDAYVNSFRINQYSIPHFEYKWHYHPEFELTLIESGVGDRFIGDSFERFQKGDLVLIGPDLPHTWMSDKEKNNLSAAVVIQFSSHFIERFLALNEFNQLKQMLAICSQGLYFPKPSIEIIHKMANISQTKGISRISILLEIFDMLTELEYQVLASPFYQPIKNEENEWRINTVFEYMLRNSSTAMSLKDVADLIHLSESAFCKFFKRMTGKTYSDYLNEIRIGKACSLLTESDKTIAEIGFQTGFESITYFNRVFLKKKARTPSEFRKMSRNRVEVLA